MVANQVTEELIRHFIGYMHLAEKLNKPPVSLYNGDYTRIGDDGPFDKGEASGGKTKLSLSELKNTPIRPVIESDEFLPPQILIPIGIASEYYSGAAAADLLLNAGSAPTGGPAGPSGGGPGPGQVAPLDIKLTYNLYDEISETIHVDQSNVLADDDWLLGESGAFEAHGINIDEELAELIAKAKAQVPDEAVDPSLQQALKEAGEDAPPVLTNVRIVNGVVQPDTETTNGDETTPPETGPDLLSQSKMAAQDIYMGGNQQGNLTQIQIDAPNGPVGNTDIDVGQANDLIDMDILDNPVVENNGSLIQVINGVSQSVEHAQTAVLGSNEAMNFASIIDFSDSKGSIIVLGDYYETNAIVQTNILADNDEIKITGYGHVESVNTKDNTTINDAEFVDDSQTVFGNPANGHFLPGLNWYVDYVEGDYNDITEIVQNNILFDNDVSVQGSVNTESNANLGENVLVNQTNIFEFGKSYDLVIVGGDYYEFNSIIQTNIILDSDFLKLSTEYMPYDSDYVSDSTSQTVESDGNDLLNLAAIVNIGGGDRFKDLSEDVKDVADQIDQQENGLQLELDLAGQLPGNGTNDVDVLFVSGDYFEQKTITQTNIVADVDISDQNTDAFYDMDNSGMPSFLQDVSSGDNAATNSATIIDVDSTSEFQFLGGDYYESSVLVQAEYVANEDTVTVTRDDPGEALAALAASTGHTDGVNFEVKEMLLSSMANHQGEDMFSGVMG